MRYTTSATLIDRVFRDHDERAWNDFFKLYAPYIRRYARNKGCPCDRLDDVTQNVVFKLLKLKKKPVINADSRTGSFRKYIMKVTLGVISDHWRENKFWLTCISKAPDEGDFINELEDISADTQSDYWESVWKQNILINALSRVRDRVNVINYDAFNMYAVENLPVATVIEAVDRKYGVKYTSNHIYQMKNRIKRFLRQEIECIEAALGDGTVLTNGDIDHEIQQLAHSHHTQIMESEDTGLLTWLNMMRKLLDGLSIDESRTDRLLILEKGGHRWYELSRSISIGADTGSDVRVQDEYVSGRHCRMNSVDNDWEIEDCGSTNGLRVNNEKVDKHRVVDGDILLIGNVSMIVFLGVERPK